MPRILLREGMIYVSIVIVAALMIHLDLLSTPSERFSHMAERGNYLHPLIYGGILYLAAAVIRTFASFIGRLFRGKRKS